MFESTQLLHAIYLAKGVAINFVELNAAMPAGADSGRVTRFG